MTQPKPTFLVLSSFVKSFVIKFPINRCWLVLNSMETFTKHQVFPYRVEFLDSKGGSHFSPGVWTNHHGPLLNVCGQIGEMTPNQYRDLNYSYGSYILSFRLIRPVRLQFFFEEDGEHTVIRVHFDCYVRSWLEPLWHLLLSVFWRLFVFSLSRTLSNYKI